MTSNRWLPLPEIYYGIATANYRPSAVNLASTSVSARNNRYSWSRDSNVSSLRSNGGDGAVGNVFEQEVLVGDEVYAFETCRSDDDVEWYRGYVLPHINVSATVEASSSPEATTEPLVYLGIFPSSIVCIQSRSQDTQGILHDVFEQSSAAASTHGTTRSPAMEPVLEEEDEIDGESRESVKQEVVHSGTPNGIQKLPPPLPNLAAQSRDSDHLVNEIGYTIRDWYDRLPAYLVERKYKLFDSVSKSIKALHTARQQMIANVLTRHEEEALRREVIFTVNKGCVTQGLDIVVRDPKSGKLAVVECDLDDEFFIMSGVQLYALQVASIYANAPLTNARLDSVISLETNHVLTSPKRDAKLGQIETYVADTADQILVEIKTLMVKVPSGDTVEIFCSIYQGSSQSYLTEEYRIELDRGIPVGLPPDTRMCTIFRGLSDLDSSCFLIVRLVRKGQRLGLSREDIKTPETSTILRTPSKLNNLVGGHHRTLEPQLQKSPLLESSTEWVKLEPPDDRVRTPLGYAALAIDRLRAESDGSKDFGLKVYAPKDDSSWATVPNELLSNRWDNLMTSSEVEGVVISAELQPTDDQVNSHSIPLSNPLNQYDVTMHFRNDIYLKVWKCTLDGAVGKQISTSLRSSVELRMEVRSNTSGARLAVIQLGGSGPTPDVAEARCVVLRRDLHPLLAEMIRLAIPDEPCHALLTICEVSPDGATPRPIGTAHLPLNSDRLAVHADGAYNLIIQPYAASEVEAMRYLQTAPTGSFAIKPSGQDVISVRVQNISARTSNPIVLTLAERRELGGIEDDKPMETLHLLTFVPPLEIVKHLPALLDATFAILTSNQTSETPETVQDGVAKALIAILDALHDRRFLLRADLLAAYLENFSWSATGLPLIKAIRRIISSPDHLDYRQTAKHLSGLLRFVIASRQPIRSTSTGMLGEHLESQLDSEIRGLINNDLPSIFKTLDPARTLGSRIILIQQFGQLSTVLSTIYTRAEIGEMLIAFADLTNYDATPSKASQAKLVFLLKDVVLGSHFKDSELRSVLLPTLCRIIRAHLLWDSSVESRSSIATRLVTARLALSTAAAISHVLFATIRDAKSNEDLVQDQDNLEYVLSALLPHIVTSYHILASVQPDIQPDTAGSKTLAVFPTSPRTDLMGNIEHGEALAGFATRNPIAGECAALILGLLVSCPLDRLESYLIEYREVHSEGLAIRMIIDALQFGSGLFAQLGVPPTWRSLRGMACRAMLSLISAARSSFMDTYQWEDVESSRELWCECLNTTLLIVREENAAMLRSSPKLARTSTWRIWSRLGGEVAALVTQLQSCQPEDLGAAQCGEALRSVIETCMLSTDTMPSLVILLNGLLRLEWQKERRFTDIAIYLAELLDRELDRPNPKAQLPKFIFLERLRDLPMTGDDAYRRGLCDLLDILEGYLSLMLRSGEANLAPHEYGLLALSIMDYTKRHGQTKLEARWCDRLHDHLLRTGYRVGAALSLARKASCIGWSVLGATGDSERELLYREAIQELESCRYWEIAAEICQALVDYHKRHTFNFRHIAELLGFEALMYSSMSRATVRETTYYRVTLIDVEEPNATLCDYIWSIEGGEAESLLRSTCAQMEARYPGIPVIVETEEDAHINTHQQSGSAIRISPYYAIPDMEKDCIKLATTLNPYYLTNDVKTFRCTRQGVSGMEFVHVHTADTLPSILPISPLIESRVENIDYRQHAIEEIRRAAQNLAVIDAGLRQENSNSAGDHFAISNLIESAMDLPHRKPIVRYKRSLNTESHPPIDGSFEIAMQDYTSRFLNILQRYSETGDGVSRSYHESLVRLFSRNFAHQLETNSSLSNEFEIYRRKYRHISKPIPPFPGGGGGGGSSGGGSGGGGSGGDGGGGGHRRHHSKLLTDLSPVASRNTTSSTTTNTNTNTNITKSHSTNTARDGGGGGGANQGMTPYPAGDGGGGGNGGDDNPLPTTTTTTTTTTIANATPADEFGSRQGAESRLSMVSTRASTTRSRMSYRFGSLMGRKKV